MFVLLFSLSSSNITVDDIAIGIWSGYECIGDRALTCASTWVRQFKSVHVFSDFFKEADLKAVQTAARPAEVHPVQLGNLAKHLWFPTAWQRAQPRFVRSMYELSVLEPHKKWYIFVDDDTYLVKRPLLEILSRFNHSTKVVVGHFYCAWPEVVFGKNHSMQCMSFPQGGAGVAISRGFFDFLAPKLLECNSKYNSPDYAGSMRFAKCAADYITDGTWRYSEGIQNFKSQFFSRNPIDEIEDNFCNRPPATFHKLSPKKLKFVHNGIISQWNTTDGREAYVDWSHLSCRPFYAYIDDSRQYFLLRFGYALSLPYVHRVVLKASSAIEPEFNATGSPIRYIQRFGPSTKVILECDDTMDPNDVQQIGLIKQEFIEYVMRVKCPQIEYHHTI